MPLSPTSDALPPGTAQITVGGSDGGRVDAVHCQQTGSLTTMTTGDPESGATAVVSAADGVPAESVQLRALAGFTGS
jgi:hypothetical protein